MLHEFAKVQLAVLLGALLCGISLNAPAQTGTPQNTDTFAEPTAEEMMTLDRLRDQMKAKGQTLTPAQEMAWLQRIRSMRALAGANGPANGTGTGTGNGTGNALAAVRPAATVAAGAAAESQAAISEEGLAQEIAAQAPGKAPQNVEFRRDGFMHDGELFADPQGAVRKFFLDIRRGIVSYVVQAQTPRGAPVRLARLGSPTPPITVGFLRTQGEQQIFESVTGQLLSGDYTILLTDGIMVLRNGVAFRYVAGGGVQQIAIPSGWYPAPLQRGNVAGTGWLLLEKDTSAERANPLNVFSGIGKALNLSAANEYALMNLKDARLTLLNISATAKSVTKMSDCRKMNSVVNKCNQATSYDSVWSPDGSRNGNHYFWRIDWQDTRSGPVLVGLENGLSQINAIDLNSGKRVNLFSRTLGINGMNVEMDGQGVLKVNAGMGFSRESVADVSTELQTREALPSSDAK